MQENTSEKHDFPRETRHCLPREREIQALRERFRLAKLDDAIETSGALNLVVSARQRSRLGPTIYAPVTVCRVKTNPLVNTGIPT